MRSLLKGSVFAFAAVFSIVAAVIQMLAFAVTYANAARSSRPPASQQQAESEEPAAPATRPDRGRLSSRLVLQVVGALTMLGHMGVRQCAGQIIVPSRTVQSVRHSFSPSADPEFPSTVVDAAVFDPLEVPLDLDSATSVSFTLNAPAGKLFRVSSGTSLIADFNFVHQASGANETAELRVQLLNPRGPTPAFDRTIFVFPGNEIVDYTSSVSRRNEAFRMAAVSELVTAELIFSGIEFVLEYDFTDLGGPEKVFRLESPQFAALAYTTRADPGPLIELVDIPEPGTLILAASWVLSGFGARILRD